MAARGTRRARRRSPALVYLPPPLRPLHPDSILRRRVSSTPAWLRTTFYRSLRLRPGGRLAPVARRGQPQGLTVLRHGAARHLYPFLGQHIGKLGIAERPFRDFVRDQLADSGPDRHR